MGLEPTNLLTASQALYQLSYTPVPAQDRVVPQLSFLDRYRRVVTSGPETVRKP